MYRERDDVDVPGASVDSMWPTAEDNSQNEAQQHKPDDTSLVEHYYSEYSTIKENTIRPVCRSSRP